MAVWADSALQMHTAVTANFGKQAVTAVCFCTVDIRRRQIQYFFNLRKYKTEDTNKMYDRPTQLGTVRSDFSMCMMQVGFTFGLCTQRKKTMR